MEFVGIIGGAGFGFLIGRFMSRFGYGCPLLCNPKISTVYFALMGYLVATGNF